MSRRLSKLAPEWWDYTTLDDEILQDAAKLSIHDLRQLQRPGFSIKFYDTPQEFYAAQALEYIDAWNQSTPDNPAGICGPIGPTEQLPIVAQMVNSLGINLKKKEAHFWGMDEWIENGIPVTPKHPLSFAKCDNELCFDRISSHLSLNEKNKHFPNGDIKSYSESYDSARCVVMQGGQGECKHWAFNDPTPRAGEFSTHPPSAKQYLDYGTRVVKLHPVTIIQNARTSGGGNVSMVPTQALTVGPKETWKAEKVSIWHPGHHDNPFGMRLTAFMISKHIVDTAVPMSLLADHHNVEFSYLRPNIGTVAVEMH